MDAHHMPPYQNGYGAADEYSNILSNGEENDNYANWSFEATHNAASNGQSDPYLAWQSNTGLESYNPHTFTKNAANLQTNSYAGYGNAHQFTASPYDPSLVSTGANGASPFGVGASPYGQQPMQHGTIAPQALEQERAHLIRPDQTLDNQSYARPNAMDVTGYTRSVSQAPPVNQAALFAAIPPGDRTGQFLTINPERLSKATNSAQVRPFIHVGQQEFEYPINRATLAPIVRRKSRNDLLRIAGNDPKLRAKLSKKPVKKTHTSFGTVRPNQQLSSSTKQELSASDTESSDYSSSDESDDEDELPPLPAQRPDDPREGVKYDTIKALWASDRAGISADRVRSGMVEFGEVVQTIRNRWKADSTALADATEKKKSGELPLLRSRVNDQLEMMRISLQTAIEHGHKAILGQLGQHPQIMAAFTSLLIDRIKASESNGPLTRLILEFLTRCENLTEKILVETKLQRCLVNLSKTGNADMQGLSKRVRTNAAEATKKQSGAEQQSKSPPSNRPTPEPVAGVKRAAPGSTQSDQAAKRVLVGPGAGGPAPNGPAKPSAVKRLLPLGNSTKPATTAKPAVGALKAKPVTSKPATSAASAGSAIKKAVAKSATPSVVAAAIKSIEKKAAPAAPAKPAFSFAETMANLNKTKEKEPTPSKAEEKQPPETPEERAKRLRKEERRKLRVTFKPDTQLVQVRIFHHDVEEELGHDASMIRDVADVGGEGRMFKQHKDMMDIDEEDDGPGEEDLREYTPVSLTDFSEVDLEERKRNYSRYGGGQLQPESPERVKREQYEASTLMVVYTDPSDIPPCPREPADPYNGDDVATKAFGTPDAQGLAAIRAAKLGGPVQTQPPQGQQAGAAPSISAILAMINPQSQGQPQKAQPAPGPPPAQGQNQMAEIQRILASIPPPQPQQPAQSQQPAQVSQPSQSTMPPNLAGIIASLQPQAQDPSAFQPVQPQQQQSAAMDSDPANLATFFAQFNQGQNGAPGANFGQYGFPGAGFSMPNMGQAPMQQLQHSAPFENEERRRWRETGDNSDQNRRGKGGRKGAGTFIDKRYTVPCKYFRIGKCQKGDSCTYLHD